MGMIRELILDIVHLHNEYTSTGMYMGLYFCMILLLGLFSEKPEHRYRVVYPALVTLFLVYFLLPFIKCFTGIGLDDLTRARSFWALMPSAVIALGFTIIASRLADKRKQIIALAAIVLILAFSGEFKINNNVFQRAENLYKLPQSLLDVSDAVLEEQEGEAGSNTVKIGDDITKYESGTATTGKAIASNAGAKSDVVLDRVKSENEIFGYDALKNEYTDMIKSGIVDPAKVTRSALENAASVASMLLTTEAAVIELPEEKKSCPDMSAMAGMGGMGGMM